MINTSKINEAGLKAIDAVADSHIQYVSSMKILTDKFSVDSKEGADEMLALLNSEIIKNRDIWDSLSDTEKFNFGGETPFEARMLFNTMCAEEVRRRTKGEMNDHRPI